MPGVELDHVAALVAAAASPERRDDRAQPAHAGRLGSGSCEYVVDRNRLREHEMLRHGGEHLRDERRAAPGDVEDEAVRLEPGLGLIGRVERRLAPEEEAVRTPECALD